MYTLNIARAIKKMSINEIRDVIFEGKQLLFNEKFETKNCCLRTN